MHLKSKAKQKNKKTVPEWNHRVIFRALIFMLPYALDSNVSEYPRSIVKMGAYLCPTFVRAIPLGYIAWSNLIFKYWLKDHFQYFAEFTGTLIYQL